MRGSKIPWCTKQSKAIRVINAGSKKGKIDWSNAQVPTYIRCDRCNGRFRPRLVYCETNPSWACCATLMVPPHKVPAAKAHKKKFLDSSRS